MALAVIVTLEKELPGASEAYAKAKVGKAMARESDKVDFSARRAGVTQPSALLSESQAALIAQMKEEGMDPTKMRLPPERFFPASDGLKVVRALIADITGHLNDFKQPNPILRDLKAAEALLIEAEKQGVKFHFSKVDLK